MGQEERREIINSECDTRFSCILRPFGTAKDEMPDTHGHCERSEAISKKPKKIFATENTEIAEK